MSLTLSRPTLLAAPFVSATEAAWRDGELVQVRDYGPCDCCGPSSGRCCSCCRGGTQRQAFLFTVVGSTNPRLPNGFYKLSIRDPLSTPEAVAGGYPLTYYCQCGYSLDYRANETDPWSHLFPWNGVQCIEGCPPRWFGAGYFTFDYPDYGALYEYRPADDAAAREFCENGGVMTAIGTSEGGEPPTITLIPSGSLLACTCCLANLTALGGRVGTLHLSFSAVGCFLTGVTIPFTWNAGLNEFAFSGIIGTCTDTFDFRIRCVDDNLVFYFVSQNGNPIDLAYPIGVTSWCPFLASYGTGTAVLNCTSPLDFCQYGGTIQE